MINRIISSYRDISTDRFFHYNYKIRNIDLIKRRLKTMTNKIFIIEFSILAAFLICISILLGLIHNIMEISFREAYLATLVLSVIGGLIAYIIFYKLIIAPCHVK